MKKQIAIASCSLAINATGKNEIQLLPAGEFSANDGRPACGTWKIDAAIAAKVIERMSRRKTPVIIDYEHQTLHKESNGQPAPAAGRFLGSDVEWREGVGLFACNVKWTPRAASMIADEEYQQISPVIIYYSDTGVVVDIAHAGLTNDPAIDGMEAVTLAAASRFFINDELTNDDEVSQMETLLELLRKILGLAETATEEEVLTALKAVAESMPQEGEMASAGLSRVLEHGKQRVEALTAALSKATTAGQNTTPDPAKYVPIAVVNDLRKTIAALNNNGSVKELDNMITAALTSGKLVPSMEEWARNLGKKDINELKTFIDDSPVIAALTREQAGNNPPASGAHGLNASQLEAARLLNMSPEEYAKLF